MTRTGVRRRRLAVVTTVAVIGGAWAAPAVRALSAEEAIRVSRTSYVVRQGDTMWSIAQRLAPGEDPRAVVDAISAANGVRAGELAPGQTLLLPVG